MIRAVLFDLGGTLHLCTTDEERKIWFARRVIHRLGEYGIVLDCSPEELSAQLQKNAEIYKRQAEATLRELPPAVVWNDYYLREQHLGREALADVAEELSFLYDYERVCNLRRPHLVSTLQALREMGIRMGLISNILSRTVVPHFVAEYGLSEFFECVLTSAGTGIRKPDPAIFRLAEEQMHLDPRETAYVGDTLSRDVRGVRNAAWRLAIQIYSPGAARRDAGLAEMGFRADYNITDLSEIPDIIRRENGGTPPPLQEGSS